MGSLKFADTFQIFPETIVIPCPNKVPEGFWEPFRNLERSPKGSSKVPGTLPEPYRKPVGKILNAFQRQ